MELLLENKSKALILKPVKMKAKRNPVSCYHSVSRRPQRNTKKTLLFLKGGKAPLAKTLAKI